MQFNLRNVFLALIAVAIAFTSGVAQTREDKTLAPYFVVQGDPSVDHLPLKDTRVEISVSGVIADVKVRQIYRNEGSRPINASYVFPASTRAAVYSMRMQIGDEIIVAKIKEREQAKKDFEQAKEEGKSASLLEQQRPNVFSMSLANLMPQEQVEIELVQIHVAHRIRSDGLAPRQGHPGRGLTAPVSAQVHPGPRRRRAALRPSRSRCAARGRPCRRRGPARR